MSLTKHEVEHIASLARIRLSEKEKEVFPKQLSSILDYVSQLQKVAAEGVEETAQVTGLENEMRKDEIRETTKETRDRIVKNFPEKDNDLCKVKSVFD